MGKTSAFVLCMCAVAAILACATVSSADPVLWTANGHYYAAIYVGSIDWLHADSAATGSSYLGMTGYLATITSADEQNFIWSFMQPEEVKPPVDPGFLSPLPSPLVGNYWLGGYQAPGSAEPGGGWAWVTGEPWTYANWCEEEPNNAGNCEDRLEFYSYSNGVWNDNRIDCPREGYIVEYSPSSPPVPEASAVALALSGGLFGACLTRIRRRI
jgi:hypothetical protein